MMQHDIPIRVYYENTDAGGIVYHAQYLNFAERGRTEFLRHVGFLNSELAVEFSCIFVVRRIEIDYLKPAILDDLLTLRSTILEMKNTSFVMHQCLYRGEEKISDIHVVLVCVDTKNYKPVRLPESVKEAFQIYQEHVV